MQMTKKVTFVLPAEIVADASQGLLLGEFNNWDKENGFSLKKSKDGSMKATVELETGKSYEYRYLLDGGRWVNDETASQYTAVYSFGVLNCVVDVPTEETVVNEKSPSAKTEKVAKKTPSKAAKAHAEEVSTDDLTRIEGIGKKIAELFAKENILTFADLSRTSHKKLKGILEAAGTSFAMHDPATWPKQSKLAAAGKWDDLKLLQDELKGGK
jgi:predicted flap endonuclease-1-like 5' DNA nuclease